jgi:hypothetical protein
LATFIPRGLTSSGAAILLTPDSQLALDAVKEELESHSHKLTVIKGGGLPFDDLSKDTHMGDAMDCWVFSMDGDDLQTFLRNRGWAAWHRTAPFAEHVHALPLKGPNFKPFLSPGAQGQVDQYFAGTDGLAGKGDDPSFHPQPQPTFDPEDHVITDADIDKTAKASVNSKAVDIIELPKNTPFAKENPDNKSVTPGTAHTLQLDYLARLLAAVDVDKLAKASVNSKAVDVIDLPENTPFAKQHPTNKSVTPGTAHTLQLDYLARIMNTLDSLVDRVHALEAKVGGPDTT